LFESFSAFEEVEVQLVEVEPWLHMFKTAMLGWAWEVVVESFSLIFHMLGETLHRIAAGSLVDVMLQT
jgi:hypothetical protein